MEARAPKVRCFETTHWSLVARAGDVGGEGQRQALAELVKRYMPALRCHLMVRKRMKAQDAEDLVQEFLAAKVIEQGLVGKARRDLGRFRSFLLTALDRFMVSQKRYEQAKKRSAGSDPVSVDEELDAEDPSQPPDQAFCVEWAQNLLNSALQRMRDECDRTGRADVWGVFEARMLAPTLDGTPVEPYERLVERFNFASPAQASNVLITAKRMFERVVRSAISEYEPDETQIEEEIADLRNILSRVTP
jgi:RNA polymerase sigma-70 factor (ECF subfamily)